MTECRHHWKLDPPVAGIVHGRCLKCGEERDFPQYGGVANPDPRHTPQIGSQAPRRDRRRQLERSRFYEEHKEEVLADLEKLGRPATLKKWNVPAGTMTGLLQRWRSGAPPPKAAAPPRPRTDEDALGRLDMAIAAVQVSVRSLEERRREVMSGAGRIGGEIYKEMRRLKELQHARAVVLEVMGQGEPSKKEGSAGA